MEFCDEIKFHAATKTEAEWLASPVNAIRSPTKYYFDSGPLRKADARGCQYCVKRHQSHQGGEVASCVNT